MTDEPTRSLEEVVREDGRYPLEAFGFLHDGLARAVRGVYGEAEPDPPPPADGDPPPRQPRHVTGQQLSEGLRDEAIERWGLLARTVLERWNVRATIDFGNMVYLLIENDLMQKTESDSIEDFRDVYDFAAAFGPEGVFEADSQA
jgi:uncharacterized repeat protein (TIGR04138 family)